MKIGFFGKLPGYGDFIQRNVSPDVINAWDNWVLQAIESAHGDLQHEWQSVYFQSPIWRFLISSSVLGDNTVTGIMMPSVDKAGRSYPFTVFCQTESDVNSFICARKLDEKHALAEEFMLDLLGKGSPNLEDVLDVLHGIYGDNRESEFLHLDVKDSSSITEMANVSEHQTADFIDANETAFEHILTGNDIHITLWWTNGGVDYAPRKRYFSGMPPVDSFQSFLRGVES